MPAYREMLDTFTSKYWLADRETRGYYNQFVEFVEGWERHLVGALAPGVLEKLGHDEENLNEFYEHLETKLQDLQDVISDRKQRVAFVPFRWGR
jgi:hypothetical protein